jgi:hypothetical protein
MQTLEDMGNSLSAMQQRLQRIWNEVRLAQTLPERREAVIKKLRPEPKKLEAYMRGGFGVEDLEAVVDRTMSEMIGFEVCEANKARRRELLRLAREVEDIRDLFPAMLSEISGGLASVSRQLKKEGII